MKPIASGRASEIFDLGDGRILRRGGDPEREARVMRNVAAHGYPVPDVLEVQADALIIERLAGPTMLEELLREPSLIRSRAALLADLQRRLHEIEAEDGTRQLHMDLHPENVILSGDGPVVVDWTNARGGEPALDVAMTWVICATSGGDLGRLFVRDFLPHFELDEIRHTLPAAAELRLGDPNVTEDEKHAVRRLLARG
jgi:aminoglycoside phosphotransferase (APT) family kinase protein